jgi:hypothetical protein
MVIMVLLGLVMSGCVERSASVALLSSSDPLSSVDFAEYVANTTYVTRYCTALNDAEDVDVGADPEEAGPEDEVTDFEQDDDDDSFAENRTSHTGHGRHIVAEPHFKVTKQVDVAVTKGPECMSAKVLRILARVPLVLTEDFCDCRRSVKGHY